MVSRGIGHWLAMWPSLWQWPHCVGGGWETHFVKVMGFPNMARWAFFMACVIVPSLLIKAKEMEELLPVMYSRRQTQARASTKCSFAQIGLRMTSFKSCSL